jgi:hypothetical protein
MNTEISIFEQASRLQLRFVTSKGHVSTEELWDLNLQSLDTIAKAVNRELKSSQEESFIGTPTTANKATKQQELRLSILKHVIAVKQEEEAASKSRAAKRAQLATLKQLAEHKAGQAMEAKSLEEINAMITELESSEM